MNLKTVKLSNLKAGPEDGLEEGQVSAVISVYGVIDHDGDVTNEDSFKSFADGFNASNDRPVPVLWHHRRETPDLVIGGVDRFIPDADAGNGRKGLGVVVTLDKETNPTAAQAYRILKGRRIDQWSYQWDGVATPSKEGFNLLSDMSVKEVSPVIVGANEETFTVGVKELQQRGAKALEAIAANLNTETVEALEALDNEGRARLALQIADAAREPEEKAGPESDGDPEDKETKAAPLRLASPLLVDLAVEDALTA